MSMKRRSDVLDSRMADKTGHESPKVVILRNGSPVFVNTDMLGKRSPSGQRQIQPHYDSRPGRRSPPLHDSETKRQYQVLYSRGGEWDGDIRQMIQSEHKDNYPYLRERRDHENVRNFINLFLAAQLKPRKLSSDLSLNFTKRSLSEEHFKSISLFSTGKASNKFFFISKNYPLLFAFDARRGFPKTYFVRA